MSAWMVTKSHIDAMVQSVINTDLLRTQPDQNPTTLGKRLWSENWVAFNIRYEGRYPEDRPDIENYVFEGTDKPLDPVAINTLIRCYHYQCSEYEECDQQPGWQLLTLLQGVLGVSEEDGLERGPWGIASIDQVTL